MPEQKIITSSANAKFFAELSSGTLMLYREKNLLWKQPAPSSCSIIGLGNNGILALNTPQGILLYSSIGAERDAPVEQYSTEVLSRTSSFIKSADMEEHGNYLAIEKVTEKTSLSERIFKRFVKDKKDLPKEGACLHEIILVDLSSFAEEQIWYFVGHKAINNPLLWKMSPDFSYYAVCESAQRIMPPATVSKKFFLVDKDNNRTLYQINFSDAGLHDLRVNYQGAVLLQIEDNKERQLIIVDKTGKRFFLTPPDTEYEIQHLGKHFVVLKICNQSKVIFKTFDDKLMYDIDLGLFERQQKSCNFIFRPNDDIVLIEHEEYTPLLKITYTTVDNFGVEYKRWQLLAEEQTKEKEFQAKQQAEEEIALKNKTELTQQRVSELALTAKSFTETSASLERGRDVTINRTSIFNQLEKLKLKYVTGDLSKDEYDREKGLLEKELTMISPQTQKPQFELKTVNLQTSPIEIPVPQQKPVITEKTANKNEIEKINNLLEKLEERFILGEVSEKTYIDLKEKYEKKIKILEGII